MKRSLLGCALLMLIVAAISPPLAAQGEATVLIPITPVEVEPWNREVLIAADGAGHVLVAFLAETGDADVAWSAHYSGGAWTDRAIPLPPGDEQWRSHALRDLAAGSSGRFVLLYKNAGSHYCYVVWSGSAWQTPVLIPDDTLDSPDGICFDAAGSVLVWDDHVPGYFARHAGGQWQSMELPQRTEDLSSDARGELMLGRDGAVHLLGIGLRKVPTVGSCPAGTDPLQPANWVFQPDRSQDYLSPLYPAAHDARTSLDWPRQTVWACWEGSGDQRDALMVAHAPIGATTTAAWTVWPLLHEGWSAVNSALSSSNAGADGVAYDLSDGHGGRQLIFRWLPPNGPGAPIQVTRPGSQTEAADFASLYNGTLAACVAPNGIAHVVIKGKKRGEYPENAERLYYSRVTGGAVLQTEPGVTGGGTVVADDQTTGQQTTNQQDWQQAGGKPDLVPELALKQPPYERDGQQVHRISYYDRLVRPEVAIRNIASQYFGDVELDLIVDGAVIHYVRHDDTDHMRPLIERDATLDVYNLPAFRYELSHPEQPWSPPELQVEDRDRSQTIEMRSGLGRKSVMLVIDPLNKIDEVNEDNNTAELTFEVSDGREEADRLSVTDIRDDRLVIGQNDLAIRNYTLDANTRIVAPGLIQAPTTARVLVGNPRGASFFRDVNVAALIDGAEVWRTTIPLIDDEYRLHNAAVTAHGWPGAEERRGADLRGGVLEVPLDLTNVPIGAHTLTIMVDPEDTCADLQRANNVATIPLRVRERGGTLQVQVRDADTGEGVSMAHVRLGDLFFDRTDRSGSLTIADVPAGDYDARELWCSRPYPGARYAGRPCDAPFTVRNGQITLATASLEQPVAVHLQLTDAETGQSLDAPPAARIEWAGSTPWGTSDSGEVVGWRQGASRLLFPDVRPGACTATADAWAYEPATLQADVHRDAHGECHLQMTLQQSPRGSVQVTVTDENGRGVGGAYVFLQGAPRGGGTDADGVATLTEVEAGSSYTVLARADGYTSGSVASGTVVADGTRECSIQVARITSREKVVSFDAIAWAQCESWPGLSFGPISSDGYEVSAEHGRFHVTLGLSYHEVAGADLGVVDEVVVASDGGPFWSENVTYEYSLTDLLCSGVAQVAGKKIAQLVKLAGPINDVYDWFNGDLDPNRLNDGEVVGTYTSWTGTEYASESLIPLPSIPFSPGMSGGQTVARTDMIEVTDGTRTKTVRRQWYSPSMMVYRIGEEFDLSKLEVRVYVAVLNDRLSRGPLYANSRNLIQWKPMEGDGDDAWVNFHPEAYDELGVH